MAKQGADLHTGNFIQVLAYEMVRTSFFDEHVRTIRKVYGERRLVMLDALERYFPEECSWTRPQGGLFLWARVPEWIDTAALLPRAAEFKVAYVPGSAFFADPGRGRNTMRLNFSNAQPAQIEEGIRRLGNLLNEVIAERDIRIASASAPVPA
jgi:2-aminoadipate transaminase